MSKDTINLEHALRVFEMEKGYKPDPTNSQDKATVGILEVGIRYAFEGNLITKKDLDSFHDVLVDAIEKTFDEATLYNLWLQLPFRIKNDAKRWGVNDTVVRDQIFEWASQNDKVFENIGKEETTQS